MRFASWRIAGLALGLLPGLRGQEALYVKDGPLMGLVVDARGNGPLIVKDGKLTEIDSRRYALKKVPEFVPVFVSIRHIRASESHLVASGGEMNHEFHFYADFDSPFRLEHVFLVLELKTAKTGRTICVQAIGTLAPNKPEAVDLDYPILGGMGEGNFVPHVFVGGREVLNSEMPWALRERILDRLVAARIRGVPDRPPEPFVGPSPEYPAALHRDKVAGQAVVRFQVGVHGEVLNPRVLSATDPAFGASALAAIRQWRFLPKVRGGRPVPVEVEFPFGFSST